MTVGTAAPETQPVRVARSPTSAASDADVIEQVNFLLRIRDTVSAANKAVITIRNLRAGLDRVQPGASGSLESLAHALDDSVTLVERALYQTRNQAGEDPLNFPIRLNNQVGALSGFVSSGERRPPEQAYDVWNTLVPQLDAQLLRLKRILATQLPPVNAALRAAGKNEIVPNATESPAPAGRRGVT
jgi:hypothetical protein